MRMQGMKLRWQTGKNSNYECSMSHLKLIGPFRQLLTLNHIPIKGPLQDNNLEIITDAGILVHGGRIEAAGNFRELKTLSRETMEVEGNMVAIPGLVDAHTHICWAGSRSGDYAMRLSGMTYGEIAHQGGGIWSTVTHTRHAGEEELASLTAGRAKILLQKGCTTVEVKSGYGLDLQNELKMLASIKKANEQSHVDLVPTCLAAHIKPRDFVGSANDYLKWIIQELLPVVKAQDLASRVDIYVDEGAFSPDAARDFLPKVRQLGFQITVHADQFSIGGVRVAVEQNALSADHLENSTDTDISLIAASGVIPVVLPGSSMGLGIGFAPARKFLDAGASLAVASDWNPGSAPMGNLLVQAAVLGMYEKLTMAESLAAITYRAAIALGLYDRGVIRPGSLADIIAYPCTDYRDILYNQGNLMPSAVWKEGIRVV
jgi:imidazolonepropionase